jgi:hypothetical protein
MIGRPAQERRTLATLTVRRGQTVRNHGHPGIRQKPSKERQLAAGLALEEK